jgi:hypothetical protein
MKNTNNHKYPSVSKEFLLSKYANQDFKNRKQKIYTTFKKCTQPAFAYFCLPFPAPINVRGKQSSTDKEVKDNISCVAVTVSYLLIALW